jgi:TusA-related sulfurtransferase
LPPMNDTDKVLDLRGVACPMNFVKTKLYVEKLSAGEVVKVLLDAGEPFESVSVSMAEEGHDILSTSAEAEGYYCVLIRKV